LGDAGVITTDNLNLRNRLKLLSNYGSAHNNKYSHLELGFNNRLDTLQASVLLENLNYLSDWNGTRKKLADVYIQELQGEISILQAERVDSVRHHFCVLVPNRSDFKKFLLKNGIGTEIHYPNVAGIEASTFFGRKGSYPMAEKIAQETLSLPLSQWHTEEQIRYVIYQVKQWING
jgi:dTDP-4-amino-4,6-dideoxygalactose transaminase